MNTLSDLRSTLGEHAEQVPHGEAVARTAAVRHRVSVVRRRRRAVGAGVLSVALLAGGAAALANRGHSDALPSAPTILGVKAPTTMTSLGYTYRTDGSSHTVEDHGTIQIDESTRPRLVTWTTDRPTTVRLQLPDLQLWTSSVSGFHDSVVIPPGRGGTLDVRVDAGQVGLAMYDVTDAQPPGVTRDGITFRDTVAGAPLLTAAIGAEGQRVVRTSFVGVRGQVTIAVLCAGLPSDSLVHVTMAGAENTAGCGDTVFDPGSDVVGRLPSAMPDRLFRSGSGPPTRGPTSPCPRARSDGVRIGVGLYGPVESRQVSGAGVDQTIEYGGHTWRLAALHRSDGSPIKVSRRPRPTVAQVVMKTIVGKPTYLHFTATEAPDQSFGASGQGAGVSGPYWVPADAVVRASRSTPGAFGVAIYTRTD